jgi:hypothetical protein
MAMAPDTANIAAVYHHRERPRRFWFPASTFFFFLHRAVCVRLKPPTTLTTMDPARTAGNGTLTTAVVDHRNFCVLGDATPGSVTAVNGQR